MPDLRKPGVYVDESLLANPTGPITATSVALFVGAANQGPTDAPVRCESWQDYVVNFGGFDQITSGSTKYLSYLPYAVYSYFQAGGRPAYIQRAVGDTPGSNASYEVTDGIATTTKSISKVEMDDVALLATITTTAAHNFVEGQPIEIATVVAGGNPLDDFEGSFVIKEILSSTKFTYEVTGTPDAQAETSATGSVTAYARPAFTVTARSVGVQGNRISVRVSTYNGAPGVFDLIVLQANDDDVPVEIERFQHLSMTGITGTRRVDSAVNDLYSGSNTITVSNLDADVTPHAVSNGELSDGTNATVPDSSDYIGIAQDAVSVLEGPVILNLVGYTSNKNDPSAFVLPSNISKTNDFPDRGDVFVINDSARQRGSTQTSTSYISSISDTLGQNTGDSYVASFTPWIIVPDPTQAGTTISIPPGGAVAGVMSRTDSTIGVFRAPAGIQAVIPTAVGVDTKFTDTELGQLNSENINVIRPVANAGIAIMGARTRKIYGADRYISARRTLIYLKESLKRSTQFALFENNDARLWTQLIGTAERLLRPLWEAGGLRGNSAAEAYYIKCDNNLNTQAVIASGEVRMEIGVALEYPAEFIVIRVTQYENGGLAAELQTRA